MGAAKHLQYMPGMMAKSGVQVGKNFVVTVPALSIGKALQKGKRVKLLIVERIKPGSYHLLIHVEDLSDPLIVTKARGDERIWATMETVLRFIDSNLPHCHAYEWRLLRSQGHVP